jgi:mannose-1-phosphate guanylyltransferase
MLAPDDRIRILTGRHLLEPFREALGEVDPSCYLVEPQARGTAPVLAWAAWTIHRVDPDAVLASLHADHAITPVEAFGDLIRHGARLAGERDALFTVAVPPTRPETGYGYIEPGEAWEGTPGVEAFSVRSFVEKPDREQAERYLRAGFLWNSGIFLWKAATFLEEIQRVTPELAGLLSLLEEGDVQGFFARAPSLSVDEGILERSSRVASLRATFRWDDLGGWEALGRTGEPDADGNVALASLHAVDSRDNIVMADEGEVVLFGVHGLVVVRAGEILMVADRERTPALKTLLQALPPGIRDPDPA